VNGIKMELMTRIAARNRGTFSSRLLLAASSIIFLFAPVHAGEARAALYELTSGADSPSFAAPSPAVYSAGPAAPLRAYFIDVGQGDAGYIELPNGRNVLIDGGPADPSGAGDPPIARFLSERNVSRIDYMVLTHPHADHYTGLLYVADRMKVSEFYDTRVDNTGTSYDEALRERLRASGAAMRYPAAGDVLDWGGSGVRVEVLNGCSSPLQTSAGQVLNDCSIVLKVSYDSSSILYTGDIQDDAEAVLVEKYGSVLKSDILKVGHHGSSHSTSAGFLSAVRPREAVISVGAGNNYGHPAPDALSRLGASGASVRRTDTEGTVRYDIGPAPAALVACGASASSGYY